MEQAKLMSVIFGCWEGGLSMRGTGGAHTHTCTRKGKGEGGIKCGKDCPWDFTVYNFF